MDLKAKIRLVLNETYGEFNTHLELEYENKVIENLSMGDTKKQKAWVTYNQVILELKHSLKDTLRTKELQYKLTGDANPNEVCIDVLENVKDFTPELTRLYYKIKNL